MSTPLLVLFTSSNDEAFGVVVPIPAAPEEGKMFVCAKHTCVRIDAINSEIDFVFIMSRNY
jgi:hypothetical protein